MAYLAEHISYLLEKIIEKRMRQAHLNITTREALGKLDDIRLTKNQIGKRVFLCPIEGDAEHKRTLTQLPHVRGKIGTFLNSGLAETLFLWEFFFSFFEKRQNSDESL